MRLMTVSKTLSPNASTMRARTSLEWMVARVEHGGEYAGDFEVGVQAVLNLLDGVDQQCDGAQREELTNQRNNDALGGGQRVDGQQTQGGLAVDEDDVVFVADPAQCRGENLLASNLVDQLNFSCGEVNVGGQQVDVLHAGGQDDVLNVDLAVHHDVVDGQVQFVRVRTETGGESTLRVEVDDEDAAAVLANAAPRLIVVVVLPTPPFWLHIAITRAGPCPDSGAGTGKSTGSSCRSGVSVGCEFVVTSPILIHDRADAAVPRARGCESVNTSRSAWAVTRV